MDEDYPKLVDFNVGKAPLTDIPARLHLLADDIVTGKIEADAVFVVIPKDNDYPHVFGYGKIDGRNDVRIQLDLAQFYLLTNIVSRS